MMPHYLLPNRSQYELAFTFTPHSSQAHLEKLIAHRQEKIVCLHKRVIRPSARGIFTIVNGSVHYNRFCIVTQVDLFIAR
jgi:hypothetical protein